MAEHMHHDSYTPNNVTRQRYTDDGCKQPSESGHRSSNQCQAIRKEIPEPRIQDGPQEGAEGVIGKEGTSLRTFDPGQRRSDPVQSRDELGENQGTKAPPAEDFMGSLGTVVWVAAKGAKDPHDLAAPLAAGLKPDKISSETSEDSDTKYETHVQPATTRESSCGQ